MKKEQKEKFLEFKANFINNQKIDIEDDMIRLLYKIVIFGFVPLLLVGSLFYFNSGDIIYGVIEISFALFLYLPFKVKKILNKQKVLLVITLIYIISFFVLLTTGSTGAGFLSIFGTIIFASIFMDKKTIYTFFTVNIFVFIVVTILLYTNNLNSFLITEYNSSWIIVSLVVNITAICIIYIENYLLSLINRAAESSINRMNYINGILNSSDQGIITVNLDQKITLMNSKAKLMLEFDEDIVGQDYNEVVNKIVQTNNRRKTKNEVFSLNVVESQIDYFSTTKNKNFIFRKYVGEIRDESQKLYAYSIMLTDITEQLSKESEIIHISLHDHLTNLYNRRYYESKLQLLVKSKSYPLSLIMIDVNGLKMINDSLGHKAGDDILIEVSKILTKTFRNSDTISRIGGDEFMILLPKTSYAEGQLLVNRLKENTIKRTNSTIPISIAVGLGTQTSELEDIHTLEKAVEDEMYSDKIHEGSSVKSKIVDMIMTTLYEKNNREMLHSKRVSEICQEIAFAMGKDTRFINQVRLAGLMHDIGKIGIDESILNKSSSLNFEEFEEIKKHPEISYRILNPVNEFVEISTFIYQHHEKLDGSGYPEGISGDEILPQSRIITVADSYDAMTGYRTYKNPLSKSEAIAELIKYKGTQFDSDVVDVFIKEVLNKKEKYNTIT